MLTVAAHNGHLRVVELLIAAGADVAAENDLGYGPQCAEMQSLHACRMW